MDFAVIFGIISFIALAGLTLYRFANVFQIIKKFLQKEGQPLYEGGVIYAFFFVSLLAWTVFFLSTFGTLTFSETWTSVKGTTTTTTTYASNSYDMFFNFLRIANFLLVMNVLIFLVEISYEAVSKFGRPYRGRFKKETSA